MRRVLLKVAYDGTRYAGFARQPGQETIEGILDQTISELTGEQIRVIGASRTDAGVHALCNIAVFDTESRIPPEKFSYALNRRLPSRIRIQDSFEVAADFHPRHCSTVKTYEYHIYNAEFEDPLHRMYSFHTWYPLDVEAMDRAGQALVGEHDFKSFCSIYTQAETTVRTILSLHVTAEPALTACAAGQNVITPRDITIRVQGSLRGRTERHHAAGYHDPRAGGWLSLQHGPHHRRHPDRGRTRREKAGGSRRDFAGEGPESSRADGTRRGTHSGQLPVSGGSASRASGGDGEGCVSCRDGERGGTGDAACSFRYCRGLIPA